MLGVLYLPLIVVVICHNGSWIYNYLCNQCLYPLTLWVWILLRQGVLDTTLCDKVFKYNLQQVSSFLWVLRLPPPIKLTATTYVTEILLKVVLITITLTPLKLTNLQWRDYIFQAASLWSLRYTWRAATAQSENQQQVCCKWSHWKIMDGNQNLGN
jgi:hypothetical protein